MSVDNSEETREMLRAVFREGMIEQQCLQALVDAEQAKQKRKINGARWHAFWTNFVMMFFMTTFGIIVIMLLLLRGNR